MGTVIHGISLAAGSSLQLAAPRLLLRGSRLSLQSAVSTSRPAGRVKRDLRVVTGNAGLTKTREVRKAEKAGFVTFATGLATTTDKEKANDVCVTRVQDPR